MSISLAVFSVCPQAGDWAHQPVWREATARQPGTSWSRPVQQSTRPRPVQRSSWPRPVQRSGSQASDGLPTRRSPQVALRDAEAEAEDAAMVVLSDVWLDQPRVRPWPWPSASGPDVRLPELTSRGRTLRAGRAWRRCSMRCAFCSKAWPAAAFSPSSSWAASRPSPAPGPARPPNAPVV